MDPFPWSPGRMLSWGDYLAEADAASPVDVRSLIRLRPEWKVESDPGGATFSISGLALRADFVPSLSWARGPARTDAALRHERARFDIAELHARAARLGSVPARLPSRGSNPDQAKQNARDDSARMIAPLVESESAALGRRLAGYDAATDGGRDAAAQAAFEEEAGVAGLRIPP
ncbi:conserved hypothetical protein [Nitrosopumilaceae archaeon]|nr:hypothetical protein [Nitrosopumilus sp.]CAI9831324.1 conserved hypothetical protein [Nitrosopumilaceae archaeon]MDA7944299.1 hypothetical protein [Nitrosopumilus sp.]MDA7954051.1 hypothetical protein [Nitrosopumilus sp.]MDA7972979.1 hypothetical protein [Nitrosopumilus sp.]